jgi:hypothetical protein
MAANLKGACLSPPEPVWAPNGLTDSCSTPKQQVRSARVMGGVAMVAIGIREIIIIVLLGIGFIIWLARRKD